MTEMYAAGPAHRNKSPSDFSMETEERSQPRDEYLKERTSAELGISATSPMSSSAVMSLAVIRAASRLMEVVLFAQKHSVPSFELYLGTTKIFCNTGAILSARRRFNGMGRN